MKILPLRFLVLVLVLAASMPTALADVPRTETRAYVGGAGGLVSDAFFYEDERLGPSIGGVSFYLDQAETETSVDITISDDSGQTVGGYYQFYGGLFASHRIPFCGHITASVPYDGDMAFSLILEVGVGDVDLFSHSSNGVNIPCGDPRPPTTGVVTATFR